MDRLRRPVVTGAAAALAGIAASLASGDPAVVVVATGICGALLGVVRSRPALAAFGAAAALGVISLYDELGPGAWVLFITHSFAVARWAPRGVAISAGLAMSAGPVIGAGDAFVPFLLSGAAPWIAGRALREHEQMGARLRERGQELEAEREEYARLSVRYERARIASELHDIVAHAMAVMVVQATAGQRLAEVDPAAAQEALAAIAGAAREAQSDLGRLVALLADSEELADAPDIALIEELVARAARTGI